MHESLSVDQRNRQIWQIESLEKLDHKLESNKWNQYATCYKLNVSMPNMFHTVEWRNVQTLINNIQKLEINEQKHSTEYS